MSETLTATGKCPNCGQRLNGSAHHANCGNRGQVGMHSPPLWGADDKFIMRDGAQIGSFITAELAEIATRAVNERAELITVLRNLHDMNLSIMPPPYGHECGWCGGCVKRAKSEARAVLDKIKDGK